MAVTRYLLALSLFCGFGLKGFVMLFSLKFDNEIFLSFASTCKWGLQIFDLLCLNFWVSVFFSSFSSISWNLSSSSSKTCECKMEELKLLCVTLNSFLGMSYDLSHSLGCGPGVACTTSSVKSIIYKLSLFLGGVFNKIILYIYEFIFINNIKKEK